MRIAKVGVNLYPATGLVRDFNWFESAQLLSAKLQVVDTVKWSAHTHTNTDSGYGTHLLLFIFKPFYSGGRLTFPHLRERYWNEASVRQPLNCDGASFCMMISAPLHVHTEVKIREYWSINTTTINLKVVGKLTLNTLLLHDSEQNLEKLREKKLHVHMFYGWENCPCDTRVTLSCCLQRCPPAERPLHCGTRRLHVPHFSVVLFSFHSVVHPPTFLHSDVSSCFCVIVVCTTWGQTVGTSLGTRYHPNWTRTGMPRGPPPLSRSLSISISDTGEYFLQTCTFQPLDVWLDSVQLRENIAIKTGKQSF